MQHFDISNTCCVRNTVEVSGFAEHLAPLLVGHWSRGQTLNFKLYLVEINGTVAYVVKWSGIGIAREGGG